MCLCMKNNWCRTFDETQGGKYPPSDHAPGCDEYHQEKFVLLDLDGTKCLVESDQAEVILRDDPSAGDYQVSDVYLTRDQFEKLPEFEGF